jgi:hypothetical protein
MITDGLGRMRRVCAVCGTKITQPTGRGASRKYCGRPCFIVEKKRQDKEDRKFVQSVLKAVAS